MRWPTVACLSLALACTAHGAEPAAATNPALTHLDDAIMFYLSFDDESLHADMSMGESAPVDVAGEPRFMDGRFGKALLLGGEGAQSVTYHASENINFRRPGAISFWIAPVSWIARDQEDERPNLRLFTYRSLGTSQIFAQRQGFRHVTLDDGSLRRRNDQFQVGYYNFADLPNAIPRIHGTEAWGAGEWRLIVFNWDRHGVALSVDGAPLHRVEFARPLQDDDLPSPEDVPPFRLGPGDHPEATLLDEFIIYRRPLHQDEIEAILSQ